MAPGSIDLTLLSTAICEGVTRGNAPLINTLLSDAARFHTMRESMQAQTDKIYALDTEIKLLKGSQVMLTGQGDGSSGLIPRMEEDVRILSSDVSGLKTDMKSVKEDVASILVTVASISQGQATQKSFMDGWKGVAIAFTVVGTGLGMLGSLAAALVWLYNQGVHH